MAAITSVTVLKRGVAGNMKFAICNVRGASSYSTGGDDLSAANQSTIMAENIKTQDWTRIVFASSEVMPTTTPVGLEASLDRTNNKILFFQAAATAGQVTAATNLSAQDVRVWFYWFAPTG